MYVSVLVKSTKANREKEKERKREREEKRAREFERYAEVTRHPRKELRPPSVITSRSRQTSSVSRRLGMKHTLVSNAIDVHTDDNTF